MTMLGRPAGGLRASAGWRRLVAAARDADRLRDAVFRAAPDAIAISDGEGRVREVNAAAEALFGRPREALVGLWMSDLVEPPAAEPRAGYGNMLAALGQRVRLDGLRPDGGRFPAEVTVQRVGSGRKTRYAAFIRDLSDEQRAAAVAAAQRQALADVEKFSAMEALLSGVAHELNNPLAIVAAQAMLLRERAADEEVTRRADRIHSAAQRAGRVVRSFTALATRRPPLRKPLALAEVLGEARDLVGHRLRQAGIAVETVFPPDLPLADGDPDLMVQVFVNLLLNAQEALQRREGERRITVRAAADPAGVAVEIVDNGPGIDPAIADRLFDPYTTTKAAGTGLGLGLSLCRSVLDQHGGTIGHRSGLDGACFRVVLPRAAPAASAPSRAARALPGLHVLVVDDEPDVASALADLIEVLGHRVAIASSAEDALARLATTPFDAVFTDYHMPGLDGAAFRARIAGSHPHLGSRTVLVTGDLRLAPPTGDRAGGLVLEKPFTAAAVQALLSRLSLP